MSADITKFFELKSACLIHDPPDKAWLVTKKENHERKAQKLASDLGFRIDPVEVAKRVDMLAASVDRWLLSLVVQEDYNKFAFDKIKIKNPFNPKFEITITNEPSEKDYNDYIEELKNFIDPLKSDPALYYHVFYALYEPLWIEKNLPPGPADTRVPTHTVFDHDYATASIMNWLIEGGKPEGLILHIDLASVQRYIESSRKLRDLWISSYIVSVLTWSLCWIFVKELGPDVLVLPTCRNNPFYYHSLLVELNRYREKHVDQNINNTIDKLKEIIKSQIRYDIDNDVFPKFAIIPSSVTLILPKIEILKRFSTFKDVNEADDLKRFIEESYKIIWNKIYKLVIESLEHDSEEIINKEFSKKIKERLEYAERFGFDKVPPLPIRIIVISTSDLYSKEKKEIKDYEIYARVFDCLEKEIGEVKKFKERTEEELKLYNMTNEITEFVKESKRGYDRGYDYCSLCGYLPAVLIISSDEERLGGIFSLGERLCPYCLVKRLLSLSPVLNRVLREILGSASTSEARIGFPSVSDIAMLPFKASVIRFARENGEKDEIKTKLLNSFRETFQGLAEVIRGGEVSRSVDELSEAERYYLSKINEIKDKELRQHLEFLLELNSEVCMLRGQEGAEEKQAAKIRALWRKFVRNLGANLDLQTPYYTLVKFDLDNFGRIIQGYIKLGFKISLEEYLIKALEGKSRDLITAIVNGNLDEAIRICRNEGIGNPEENVGRISEVVKQIMNNGRIIVSPSYHASLSRSLMRNAIRSAEIITRRNGVVVYAGGDDLLAVMPVHEILDVVKELRIKISFPDNENIGFERVNGAYYLPTLATGSASFSVYVTHFMYPMYVALNRLVTLLEEYAKEAILNEIGASLGDEELRKKDKLVITYSARGGERNAILTLSDLIEVFSRSSREGNSSMIYIVNTLNQKIENEIYSVSLIYDLLKEENKELIINLIENDKIGNKEKMLKSLLNRIFQRNKRRSKSEEDETNKLISSLLTQYNKYLRIDEERRYAINEIFDAVKIYRSGLKEA